MRKYSYRLTISAHRSVTSFCLDADDDLCAIRQTDRILSSFEGADADVTLMLGSAVIYNPRRLIRQPSAARETTAATHQRSLPRRAWDLARGRG